MPSGSGIGTASTPGSVAPIAGVLAISAATLAELHVGVLAARTPDIRAERLRRLSVLQQQFDALPVDEAVAVSYGRLVPRSPMPAASPGGGSWTCSSPPPPTAVVSV